MLMTLKINALSFSRILSLYLYILSLYLYSLFFPYIQPSIIQLIQLLSRV